MSGFSLLVASLHSALSHRREAFCVLRFDSVAMIAMFKRRKYEVIEILEIVAFPHAHCIDFIKFRVDGNRRQYFFRRNSKFRMQDQVDK